MLDLKCTWKVDNLVSIWARALVWNSVRASVSRLVWDSAWNSVRKPATPQVWVWVWNYTQEVPRASL